MDYLYWFALLVTLFFYGFYSFFYSSDISETSLGIISASVFELLNKMWLGLAFGIVSVGLLSRVPREFVISVLGSGNSLKGILRATLFGVLLDLCNHGILLVGMKLYERGATLGQVMAFLIASPWNSLSLTLILFGLIGLKWTIGFILLSAIIAIISGMIFQYLVEIGKLPANSNSVNLPKNFRLFKEGKSLLKEATFDLVLLRDVLIQGFLESKMIIKWIFVGVILASLFRAYVPSIVFQEYFGPSILGLAFTILAATLIEVCSEGSVPIAAELFSRAKAPGNSFAFLMTGVATDYTEIMSIKETTKSWEIALLLPVISTPQVLIIAYILNLAT